MISNLCRSRLAFRVSRRNFSSALISKPLREQYMRDGFAVLPNVLDANSKNHLLSWTEEVEAWPEVKGKWMKYFEVINGERSLCRVENFLDHHKHLEYVIGDLLTKAASELMQDEMILFKEKINFKLGGGAGFKAHQDAPAWSDFGGQFMTAMVAVDEATLQNGCLYMVRGEHGETYPHSHPEGEIPQEYQDRWTWEPVTLSPGDVVFFDQCVPHRSGPNTTGKPRRAYYLTYAPKHVGTGLREKYYQEKRRLFPPELERDPNVDYASIGAQFNLGNPVSTTKIVSQSM